MTILRDVFASLQKSSEIDRSIAKIAEEDKDSLGDLARGVIQNHHQTSTILLHIAKRLNNLTDRVLETENKQAHLTKLFEMVSDKKLSETTGNEK